MEIGGIFILKSDNSTTILVTERIGFDNCYIISGHGEYARYNGSTGLCDNSIKSYKHLGKCHLLGLIVNTGKSWDK